MKGHYFAATLALVLAAPFVVAQSSAASTSQTRLNVHLNRSAKFPPNSLVQVIAWPNATALSKLKPGDSVPVVTIASSHTDEKGDSQLVMDASSLASSYLDALGQLSLEVRVQHGAYLADYTLPTARTSVQSLAVDSDRAKVVVTSQSFMHSGLTRAGTTPLVSVARPAKIAVLTLPKVRTSFGTAAIACTTTVQPSDPSYKQSEEFTTVWTANDIKATIREKSGSTHTIEMGSSATGATGTWTASGTSNLSTTNTSEETRDMTQPTHWGNTVNMAKYLTQCGPTKYYTLKAGSFAALINQYYINTVRGQVVGKRYSGAGTYCIGRQANPGTSVTSMSKSQTVSGGVTVAGVSLNVSTAWTRDVDITWSPTVPWDHCYNSASGIASATDSEVHAA